MNVKAFGWLNYILKGPAEVESAKCRLNIMRFTAVTMTGIFLKLYTSGAFSAQNS